MPKRFTEQNLCRLLEKRWTVPTWVQVVSGILVVYVFLSILYGLNESKEEEKKKHNAEMQLWGVTNENDLVAAKRQAEAEASKRNERIRNYDFDRYRIVQKRLDNGVYCVVVNGEFKNPESPIPGLNKYWRRQVVSENAWNRLKVGQTFKHLEDIAKQ